MQSQRVDERLLLSDTGMNTGMYEPWSSRDLIDGIRLFQIH
jgi:hypothetical protein